MKGYRDVEMIHDDRVFDCFPKGTTPVAVEVRDNSESLLSFEHPENPLYVFGPEDGSIPSHILAHCHRFVQIPTAHCLNLSTAVATVLYDWKAKRHAMGYEDYLAPRDYLNEHRGPVDGSDIFVGVSESGLGKKHATRRV